MKKGEMLTNTMFSLVASAFIMVMLINMSISFATNEQFYKKFQAFDIKYTLHALEAVPGNAVVYYPENTTYTYEFKDSSITIKTLEIESNRQFGRAYLVTQDFNKVLEKPDSIVFTKIGDEIFIDQELVGDINELDCKKVEPVTALLFSSDEESKAIIENLKKIAPFVTGSGSKLHIQKGKEGHATVFYSNELENTACNLANAIAKHHTVSGYSIVPQDSKGIRLFYGWEADPVEMSNAIIEGLQWN